MNKRQSQRESFVVRIWWEPDRSGWQGWVQHVSSGRSAALQNLDELLPFIERWVTAPSKPDKRGLK